MMSDNPFNELDVFVHECHRAAGHGLMRCSSGNISLRINGGSMLATASGSWMSRLTADQVAVCRISDGSAMNGKKATFELAFHAGILRTRPDINVVMHFQSDHATTLACQEPEYVNFFVIPEIPFHIGPIAQVDYFRPGSEALAHAVIKEMADHDLVMMKNHGQVTVGRDFNHVIQNAVFFETACKIIIHGGKTVRPLTDSAAQELLSLGKSMSRSLEK